MSCKRLLSCASAFKAQSASIAAAICMTQRRYEEPIVVLILSVIPNTPSSIQASVRQSNGGVAFQITANPVRNNFNNFNLRVPNRYDATVVLSHVVTRNNPV